jgi:hypothetical protein
VHHHPGFQLGQEEGSRPGHPDGVGGGRVGSGPELVKVAPAREGGPGASQVDLGDRPVEGGHGQRLDQAVAHGRAIGVVNPGPVERDVQHRSRPLGQHGRALLGGPATGRTAPAPGGESRASLEGRVAERLDDQSVGHRQVLGRPEHPDQHPGGHRLGRHRLHQLGQGCGAVGQAHRTGGRGPREHDVEGPATVSPGRLDPLDQGHRDRRHPAQDRPGPLHPTGRDTGRQVDHQGADVRVAQPLDPAGVGQPVHDLGRRGDDRVTHPATPGRLPPRPTPATRRRPPPEA